MNKESLIRQLNIVKEGFNKSIDIVIKELEKSKKREKDRDKGMSLTLEQMKKMLENSDNGVIGVHVWVVDKDGNKLAAILDYCTKYGICAIYGADDIFFTESNYGTEWLAYKL